jgi:serine phosphatase RsbU (regulator of sigma subunit)
MELLAKNAGAPRAALLLGAEGQLALTAQLDVARGDAVRTGLSGGVAACPDVSAAMVELAARSRQPLVLADARLDRRFAGDPRVLGSDLRSALVVPLVHQGRLVGVLYLEHPEPDAFTTQRVTLVGVLAAQAAIALENARLYAAQTAHAERLEHEVAARTHELRHAFGRLQRELAGAAAYVRELLPAPIADGAGPVATDWRFVPCAELGGDAFDYLWLDDEHFALYMFDVCGHGVGPAVQSLSVLRTIRARQLGDTDLSDPAAVCAAVNAAFGADFRGDRYFTMWYGVYEPRHRRLRYTSAGHPPAVLVEPGAGAVELETEAAPLALVPDAVFPSAVRPVAPGSRLYVLTDGVYEVRRPDGSVLPYDHIRAELAQGSRLPRGEVIERVLHLARATRGDRPLADDFSLLAVDFLR